MSRGFSDLFSFESLAHATSGSIGSSIAMTLFYPLDQLRLVLQADESKGRDKKSELAVARDIYEREGVVGFYKGLPPLLVALGVSNFVYFYCFNALKTAVVLRSNDGKISTAKNLLVASIAGAINVLLTCPLWVASTRLKLQANPNAAHAHSKATPPTTPTSSSSSTTRPYAGLVDAVTRIGREEGVAALWNGTAASLVLVSNPTIQVMRFFCLSGILIFAARPLTRRRRRRVQQQFTAYEQGKQKLQAMRGANVALTSPEIFVLASYSKAVATLLTYPVSIFFFFFSYS